MKRLRRSRINFIILIAALCVSCTKRSDEELSRARSEVEAGRFQSALQYFERALAKANNSDAGNDVAREASRVSLFELKDYKKALTYYQYLVLNSKDSAERIESQKQIVNIYFNHLADYPKAIGEIYKLTQMITDGSEKLHYRIMLAKAYYYTGDFFQSESEVDEFLRSQISPDSRYELLLLKSNIATGRKQTDRATEILGQILNEFPERAKKENIGMALAVAYEDSGQYDRAITELMKLKEGSSQPETFEIRIKRLQDRKKNQPGRRGHRK